MRTLRPRATSLAAALLIVLGLVLAPAALAARPRMTAELHPSEIPLGQSARLVITITGVQNAPAPRIAPIDGLQIQGLGQTTSVQIINGEVNAEVTHNYMVEPTRTGSFTIPALSMQVDAETLSTTPLTLSVVDANAVPRAGIAPRGGGASPPSDQAPVSLRVTLPQRDLYVGEVLPVDLTLYIREGVRVTEVTAPTFAGNAFTVSRPQDGQPTQTTEVIDGVRYVIATFPLAISPVSAGEAAIEGKIEVTAIVPGGRRRFGAMDDPFFESFFGGGGQQKKIPLSSEPRQVRVLPLPDAGRPADFSGAIGKFTVNASATPKQVTVGDPITLTVTVSGKGNFDRLTIPALEPDNDWKTYAASSKFTPTDPIGVAGRKVSEQAIVPQQATLTAVPPRPFSYFDPEKRRYVELNTQPIALTVAPAPHSAKAPGVAAPSAARDAGGEAVDAGQWELAPNQIVPGASERDSSPLTTRPWFLALQVVPLLLLAAGALWARRRDRLRADPAHGRRLAARRRVDAENEAMQRAARDGDTHAFFAAARRAVQECLARDPARAAESLTLAELEHLVADAKLRDEVRDVVGRADAIAYSAEQLPAGHLNAWQSRVTALLQALEDTRRKGR